MSKTVEEMVEEALDESNAKLKELVDKLPGPEGHFVFKISDIIAYLRLGVGMAKSVGMDYQTLNALVMAVWSCTSPMRVMRRDPGGEA